MQITELLSNPATWIILAAVSEVIALSPLRSNSIIQLVLQALFSLKPVAKKKGLSVVPHDARWLFRFNSRSPLEKLRRILAAQKFHATLKGKLDAEISKVSRELDRQESRGGRTPNGIQGQFTEHPIDPENIGTPAELPRRPYQLVALC